MPMAMLSHCNSNVFIGYKVLPLSMSLNICMLTLYHVNLTEGRMQILIIKNMFYSLQSE